MWGSPFDSFLAQVSESLCVHLWKAAVLSLWERFAASLLVQARAHNDWQARASWWGSGSEELWWAPMFHHSWEPWFVHHFLDIDLRLLSSYQFILFLDNSKIFSENIFSVFGLCLQTGLMGLILSYDTYATRAGWGDGFCPRRRATLPCSSREDGGYLALTRPSMKTSMTTSSSSSPTCQKTE